MFKNNRNLIIIAIIALVNSLGYGIIIPILDAYTDSFGLNNFQYGLLFAVFSLGQFLSTPIIGRLSDKYGRRPLLIVSLIGTACSFFMMAFAQNALMLFVARALDGITAGNIPVASAVISDTTEPKDRARGFSIMGASFGFGFVFGPAIAALTVGINQTLPFIIAGLISTAAVLVTTMFLPETNKHMGEVKKGKLFDLSRLGHALIDKNVGVTFIITLLYFIAFGMLISSFQPFAKAILGLSPAGVAYIFTLFGIVGLITQLIFVHRITKYIGLKKAYSIFLFLLSISFLGYFLTNTVAVFVGFSVMLAMSNSSVNPLTQTILSKETDEKSQGSMLGLNASYMAIGYILGPLIGGTLFTLNPHSPFLLSSVLCFICFLLSFQVLKVHAKKESAF